MFGENIDFWEDIKKSRFVIFEAVFFAAKVFSARVSLL